METVEDFVELLWQERAVAVLRASDRDVARQAMQAAVDGGFRVLEFTFGTPGTCDLIEEFAARPGLVLGAGTVLRAVDVRRAVDAGARFIVSPVVDEAVIDAAHEAGVACMPGTRTPTEMVRAWRAGAPLQKLFPAPGPDYVRACLGPLPFLRLVPTSGVRGDDLDLWFDAGAWAVGLVGPLFDPAALAARRYDDIRRRAQRLLDAARAAPRPPRPSDDPFTS